MKVKNSPFSVVRQIENTFNSNDKIVFVVVSGGIPIIWLKVPVNVNGARNITRIPEFASSTYFYTALLT